MFYSVSWSEYFAFVAVAVTGYYVFVGWKYFKWELRAIIGVEKEEKGQISRLKFPVPVLETNPLPETADGVDLSFVIHSFTDEIVAFAEEASRSRFSKSQILNSLEMIASKYPVFSSNDNKRLRNDIILHELNGRLPDAVSLDDLRTLRTL